MRGLAEPLLFFVLSLIIFACILMIDHKDMSVMQTEGYIVNNRQGHVFILNPTSINSVPMPTYALYASIDRLKDERHTDIQVSLKDCRMENTLC